MQLHALFKLLKFNNIYVFLLIGIKICSLRMSWFLGKSVNPGAQSIYLESALALVDLANNHFFLIRLYAKYILLNSLLSLVS